MLVLHVPYALQHTTANRIAQILRCCLRVNVPEVHGPVRSPGDTEPLRCEGRVRGERPEAANIGVDGAKRRRSRLCDKGLSRDSLGGLCGGLLRFGDVRATIFSIVDPLSSPCGFCWECVYNLEEEKTLMRVTENGGTVPLWRQRCSKSEQTRYSCHGQF
jgi:hypothetical protein